MENIKQQVRQKSASRCERTNVKSDVLGGVQLNWTAY